MKYFRKHYEKEFIYEKKNQHLSSPLSRSISAEKKAVSQDTILGRLSVPIISSMLF